MILRVVSEMIDESFASVPFIMPRSTATNIDNNEIRIKRNNFSGHIPLTFLFVLLTFVLHYSAFFSILVTCGNVLNSLKRSCLLPERTRIQNVTRPRKEWTRKREEIEIM